MECGQIQKRMPAYVDGMDSPEERAFIERHLATCIPCRNALEEYQKAREVLKGLEEVDPPPGFTQKIMAQVREEKERGGIFKKLFYPLHVKVPIQAVATIVIAVLAIQIYRSIEPQKGAVTPYGVTVPAAPKEEPRKEKKEKEDKQEVSISPATKSPQAEIRKVEKAQQKAETSQTKEKTALAPTSIGAGAAPSRDMERAEAPLAQKRARMQPEAPTPSPKMEMASPRQAEPFTLRLAADDIAAAGKTVESVLRDLGGERVERSLSGETEIVTADLPAQRMKDLFEKLRSFSEAKEKDLASKPAEGIIALRIEIRQK